MTDLIDAAEGAAAASTLAGAVLAGGNEMGELMRAYDWSSSPVGPIGTWPQSLRTAVSILLDSRYPMYVAWGPAFVQFYNDAYRPILGATKHPAALGRSTRETFAEIWEFIGPMFQRVMASGEATFLEDQLLPLDRYGYVEECYFTFCYSAIRNEAGDVGGVFVTCSENTTRVLGERRLRTLRDLGASSVAARTAEAAVKDAVRVLDQNPADLPFSLVYLVDDGVARLVASAGIDPGAGGFPARFRVIEPSADGWPFGAVPTALAVVDGVEEHCGMIPSRPWPEPVHSAAVVPVPRSGQEGVLDAVLVVGLSPRRAFEEDYRTFVSLAASQIGSAIAAARAYEAERRRAQVLAELDRAKTTFFSNVSHEFRTPLTLMLGPLEDLLRRSGATLSPADRESLEMVQRNGVRLLNLVNTLLDFARIEAGRVHASFQPVDLARFTADLASTFRSAIERAGMKLIVDVRELGEPVFVDPTMWEKIVLNLLSNAFKFTLEGEIRVSLARANGCARLTIADTGVGIAPEELPHIFERFRRVEGTRARTVEGSGIGLALVQELIHLHGGRVAASSEPGKGTAFTIEIPLGTAHLPAEQVRGESSTVPPTRAASPFVEEALRLLPVEEARRSTIEVEHDAALDGASPLDGASRAVERARVLVVDDNADMRSYLGDLLGPRYEVELASDGVEALECVRRDPPALVVSDVMMPRLDGFGLVQALRSDPLTASIPIILLSARAGEESTVEGLAGGADDYLTKPFSARELLARVRAHLEFSRALRLERARLVALFEQSPSFIAVLKGPEHVLEAANGAYLALVGRHDIVGKPLLTALPELAGQGFKELLDRVYASGVPYVGREARVALVRAPGQPPEEAYVDFVYNPILEPDGTISGVFVHGVDVTAQVTARKDMEQLYRSVKEANEAKQQFLAAMSHELRTPLNAVLGYTDLLALGVRGEINDAQRTDIERIRAASQYLLTLINDILNFSKVEAGQIDLHPAPISVERVLSNARELMLPHLERQGLRQETAPVDPALEVLADPERLQQIVLNILVNAVKFTPPGGEIRLSADAVGDQVRIHVEDTGRGIAADQLERIFEPFVQADRAASPESQKGLGLGLAISRELARRMSGDVSVVSQLGRGSRFTVVLPRAARS